ncbi:MAG: DUF1826 domain-containing protein [Sulfitobacter sp.]
MTIQTNIQMETPSGVAVTETPDGLRALKDAACAAAVWNRQPVPSFQNWIDHLSPDHLPSMRVTLHPDNIRAAMTQACDAADLPDSTGRQHLISDVTALADTFCDLLNPPLLRLRMDRITTNACRRFHVDALTARLVCTYRGAGTQYGVSQGGAEPEQVFTVPTGDPILLRGTLWPEQPSSGLLHRSPPIEGTGETRLVLVLDPVFER